MAVQAIEILVVRAALEEVALWGGRQGSEGEAEGCLGAVFQTDGLTSWYSVI